MPSVSVAAPPTGAPTETHRAVTGGRRFGWWMLSLAIVAGLLAGYAAGVVTLRPAGAPGDTSAEAGFARDMIDHHAQAVSMSMIALQEATLPGVRHLAYDIATGQQGQIGTMYQWLRDWGRSPTRPAGEAPMAWMPGGDAFVGNPMPGMATPEQLGVLDAAEGSEVDRIFLALMITHHLGGIHMVDGVLDLSGEPEVTFLAGIMKDGQQRELEVMQQLQAEVRDPTS